LDANCSKLKLSVRSLPAAGSGGGDLRGPENKAQQEAPESKRLQHPEGDSSPCGVLRAAGASGPIPLVFGLQASLPRKRLFLTYC